MRVFVAVDNLLYSKLAVESLKQRHWPDDTEFMLCHVVEQFDPLFDRSDASQSQDHLDKLADDQQRYIDSMIDWLETMTIEARQTLPNVESTLGFGNVVAQLLLAASSFRADYIVMGSHHRTEVERAWLGSVAAALTDRVRCCLEIIRPRQFTVPDLESLSNLDLTPKNIVIALDASTNSRAALEWAASIAFPRETRVALVSVIDCPQASISHLRFHTRVAGLDPAIKNVKQSRSQMTNEVRRYASFLRSRAKFACIEERILEGQPAARLVEFAQERDADLIVLGAHREGASVLGSVARAVVEQTHCSIAV
ncbi:MAG TPA: universal stress protein, partial [Candidatus Obscuribacterales bacterium]